MDSNRILKTISLNIKRKLRGDFEERVRKLKMLAEPGMLGKAYLEKRRWEEDREKSHFWVL